MKTSHSRMAALGLLCAAASVAQAQWSWIDRDGHKVFSDRPPPADVKDKDVVRRPAPVAAPPKAATTAAAPDAPAPKPGGTDHELAAKLRRTDAAEAARKKADQDRDAQTRADNCERAKQAKATYESGMRLARVNAQGQRELLDDEARGTESRRLDSIIASDCR